MTKYLLTSEPRLPEAETVSVDVETWEGKLALFQFSDGDSTQIVKAKDLKKEFVKALFEKEILGFNFHFDLVKIAFWAGEFIHPKRLIDVKTMFHLCHPGKPASLKAVCAWHGISISKEMQESNWSKRLSDEQLEYASKDVEVLFNLREKMNAVEDVSYFRLETEFVSTCAFMTWCGISIRDPSSLIEEWKSKFKELKVTFRDGLFDREVNHNSHKDVKLCFKIKHNVELRETNVEELGMELGKIKDEQAIFDIKTILRKRSTQISLQYLEKIKKLSVNGRVHPTYNPLVRSATGRSSSKEPNAQNPPGSYARSNVRSVFFNDKEFVYFDLPNIHARIAAELSQDVNLVKAFKEGMDLHSITSAGISHLFNVDPKYVEYDNFVKDKELRELRHVRDTAKNVFYGSLNGQGVNGLSRSLLKAGIKVDNQMLKKLLAEMKNIYPGMTSYIQVLGNKHHLDFRDGFRVNVTETNYNDKIAFTWLHYEAVFMKYILNKVKEDFGSKVEINNFMHDSAMFFPVGVSHEELMTGIKKRYTEIMQWFFKTIPVPELDVKKVKEMPV